MAATRLHNFAMVPRSSSWQHFRCCSAIFDHRHSPCILLTPTVTYYAIIMQALSLCGTTTERIVNRTIIWDDACENSTFSVNAVANWSSDSPLYELNIEEGCVDACSAVYQIIYIVLILKKLNCYCCQILMIVIRSSVLTWVVHLNCIYSVQG